MCPTRRRSSSRARRASGLLPLSPELERARVALLALRAAEPALILESGGLRALLPRHQVLGVARAGDRNRLGEAAVVAEDVEVGVAVRDVAAHKSAIRIVRGGDVESGGRHRPLAGVPGIVDDRAEEVHDADTRANRVRIVGALVGVERDVLDVRRAGGRVNGATESIGVAWPAGAVVEE